MQRPRRRKPSASVCMNRGSRPSALRRILCRRRRHGYDEGMPPAEHSTAPVVSELPSGSAASRGFAASRWPLLFLALIVGIAVLLRLWQAGESLWIDELHTSWVVSGKL